MVEQSQTVLLDSPIGTLEIVYDDEIRAIQLSRRRPTAGRANLPPIVRRLRQELEEYFHGRRKRFTVRLKPQGTPFQTAVWREMARIPYGRTVSYGELAARVGKPGAARAVGNVCNKNPYLILVPCHRVVGSKGGLGGFAHSLEKKRYLLSLESSASP